MAVRINPQTGMMETVPDSPDKITPQQVAKTRKTLRDMLDGNIQFHDDEFAEKKQEDEKPVDEQSEYGYPGYFGYFGIRS